MDIKQLAKAFASQGNGSCHNATVTTDTSVLMCGRRTVYRLHGHAIAELFETTGGQFTLIFDWCGRYSPTTANHIGKIHQALDLPGCRPSRAKNQKAGVKTHRYYKAFGGPWVEGA